MASRFPPSPTPPETEAKAPPFECDSCGKSVEGEPAGRGLYVWNAG